MLNQLQFNRYSAWLIDAICAKKTDMKTLQIELSDEMAREVENAIEAGTFQNAAELVRASLREFISRRRFELMEQQQLQDVAWALREKPAAK